MRYRPWPIVILALCHFLAPLGNGILSAFLEGVPVMRYFPLLVQTKPVWVLVDFFLMPPLAGWAIYKCRKWSYPVFLGGAALTILANFMTWKQHPRLFSFPMFLATVALDIAFVTYFLLPSVRAVYLDPRLRWWESKARFLVRLKGRVTIDGHSDRCTITDISEGGVFIRTSADLALGTVTGISFHYFGRIFSAQGRIVYGSESPRAGYGVQFIHTRQSRKAVRRLTKALRISGVRTRNPSDWRNDFARWARTFLTTGKGWRPQPPVKDMAA